MVRVTPVRLAFALTCVQWLLLASAAFLSIEGACFSKAIGIPDFEKFEPEVPSLPGTEHRSNVADLAGIWKRSLRQALIEPPPLSPPPPKPPPPPPRIALPQLAATFVEQGRAWAMFIDEKGVPRVRAASDRIGDFVIKAVSPGAATLSSKDQIFEVRAQVRRDSPKQHESRPIGPKP